MRLLNFITSTCLIVFGAAITLSPSARAGNKLYSLDFESAGWESQFTGQSIWGSNIGRTTNAPRSGSYSLRGNQISGRNDGITGLPGISNTQLDWRGPNDDIVTKTPNELYFSYWFRHDDYNHVLQDNGSGEGKLMFFVDQTYNIKAMYINNQLAAHNALRLTYSNGGYSFNWAQTNWGYFSLDLTNPNVPAGTNGGWRHFEFYINYQSHYIQIWVDGHIMKSWKHGDPAYPKLLSDGRTYYDPSLTLKIRGFQLFWVRSANIDTSTNGTGYAAGWQIDDIEVWDGMPTSTQVLGGQRPSNLTVQ